MGDPTPPPPHDEFDLIRWIRRQVGPSPSVPVGIGDDCAALALPPDTVALVTTDMLIDGVHFRSAEAPPRQVGHKAVARALSDIAAMAGDAVGVVAAIAAPRRCPSAYLQDVIRGMLAALETLRVRLVGGDMAVSDGPLTITLTCIGCARLNALATRSAARPGDMLLVTGELGGSLAGRHLTFLPRLAEVRRFREWTTLHAMIDISDGLASDAQHLVEESAVGIEIWEEAVPIGPDAVAMAQTSGRSPLEHALHDGEDYELLFTVSARDAERLLVRRDLPVKVTCIGEVISERGLWIRRRNGPRRPLDPKGWRHTFAP